MLTAICKLVQKGLAVSHAAERVRVHHSTVARWRTEDPDFDEALKSAEAAFIERQTENIQRAADKGNFAASAWLLERKHPAYYSQPQIQLHMGVGGVPFESLDVLMERMRNSPEAVRRLAEEGASLPPPREKLVEGHDVESA
jgi:hypothetical protein